MGNETKPQVTELFDQVGGCVAGGVTQYGLGALVFRKRHNFVSQTINKV